MIPILSVLFRSGYTLQLRPKLLFTTHLSEMRTSPLQLPIRLPFLHFPFNILRRLLVCHHLTLRCLVRKLRSWAQVSCRLKVMFAFLVILVRTRPFSCLQLRSRVLHRLYQLASWLEMFLFPSKPARHRLDFCKTPLILRTKLCGMGWGPARECDRIFATTLRAPQREIFRFLSLRMV